MTSLSRLANRVNAYPLKPRDRNLLALDMNEFAFAPSPAVVKALEQVARTAPRLYPDGAGLQQAMAGAYAVPEGQVLPTSGGDEAIKLVFLTLTENGSPVYIPTPCFGMIRHGAALAGADVRELPMDPSNGFAFPEQAFARALQEASPGSLFFLTDPNNPTGTPLPDGLLEFACKARRDCWFVLDEVYTGFGQTTRTPLLADNTNLLLVKSLSKTHGLAGLRVGALLGPEDVLQAASAIQGPFTVNRAACAGGAAALGDEGYFAAKRKEVVGEREQLAGRLLAMGLRVSASRANFLLFEAGPGAPELALALKEQGILVRSFGEPVLNNWLRVTVGREEDNRQFLTALTSLLTRPLLGLDMDGTLVDTRQSYDATVRRTVQHFSPRPVSDEELARARREPGCSDDWQTCRSLLRQRGLDLPMAQIIKTFQSLFLGSDQNDGLRLNERWLFSREELDQWRRTFRLVLITSRPREEALWTLAERQNRFAAVIAREDVEAMKPSPAPLLKAKTLLRQPLTAYVGDSADDRLAAQAAGVPFFPVCPDSAPSRLPDLIPTLILQGVCP